MQVVGEARDPQRNELVYREIHRCDAARTACTVQYLDSDGELIASKWLDYSGPPAAPSLRFEDYRHGEQVRVDSDAVSADVVIDAGFDNYVRARWPQLAAGETVAFEFLVAGREQPLAMQARRDGDCPPSQLCLVIAPRNWLFALVGGDIKLVYESATRRLLQFRGLSNIPDKRGRSQHLVIDYRYPGLADGTDAQ